MTRILLMAGLLLTGTVTFNEARADVAINSTNFPDETFRKFVKDTKAINPDGNSTLTDKELKAVTTMDVSNRDIADLTGIKYFTNLTTLKCANCNLKEELRLSNFEKLETLDCQNNSNLSKLEVRNCNNLKTLVCNDCALTGLTFSNVKNLQYLRCYNNSLKNLNLSGFTALKEVVCYQNKLRGNDMTAFINNLPTTTNEALLYVCKDENSSTGNQVTYEQAQAAKANWTLMKYITDSWALYAGNNIPIDVTIFPDEYLLNYAKNEIDTNENGYLSDEEVESVTTILTDWGLDIRDFSCLRLFTQLTTLRCENCKLTGIDLSANKKLKSLSLQNNLLTSIDLSNNTQLEMLNCSKNDILSLDLSNNKALKSLSCVQNGLSEIDLSANTQLEFLECYNNHLQGEGADIFISKLPDRKDTTPGVIYFYRKEPPGYNNLTSGQLENIKAKNWNAKQYYYDGYDDRWVDFVPNHTGIYIGENTFPDKLFRRYVETFDKDDDGYLNNEEVAAAKEINFTSSSTYMYRDIESFQGIEFLTQLETLKIRNKKATSFDASAFPQLKTLSWSDGALTSLNVSGCTELTSLSCSSNKLTSIDGLSSCTQLTELYCTSNPLGSLDLSNRTSLKTLSCGGEGSELTTLDVSGCSSLEYLSLKAGGVLSSLNASGCTKLEKLYCYQNQLTSLDVSGCTQLKSLDCSENQLTSLDVSSCTKLEYLDCYQNQLTSLNVSGCTKLKQLQCHENQLTSLEISDLESQCWFKCKSNPLVTLKVTNCTGMTSLSFYDLQLASIDLSGCPSLNDVYLPGNRIRGKAMDDLIEALPVIETTNPDEMGYFYCINMHNSDEQSRITPAQAARLNAKGWRVWAYCYLYNGRSYEYDGHGTGDVDGNGIVDADDVNMTVSHILGLQGTGTDSRAQEEEAEAPEFFPIAADVSGDGEVDITDLTQIISKVGTVVYEAPEQ